MSEVIETTLEGLEKQRNEYKLMVEKGRLASKLYSNPDFKKLIVEGFMRDDAAMYVQLSQDPSLTEANQRDALNIAQASGHLKRYLSVLVQMGFKAEDELEPIDEALAEVRAQEAGE